MTLTLVLLAFIFGSIIGSFLNVVIYRYGAVSVAKGRSKCMTCDTEIRKRDLIPILSFLMLGGKCHHCKSKLDTQYILVETSTALLASISAYILFSQDITQQLVAQFFVLNLSVFPLLVIMFVYDLRHKYIPDVWNYSFAVSALLYQAVLAQGFPDSHILLAGISVSFLPFVLYFVSKGKWIGLADPILFVGVGYLLGPILGISALMLSYWIGAFVSVLLMSLAKNNKLTLKSEVPFGPFIIAATLIVFFMQKDLIGITDMMLLFNQY